jgi:hypothetical protein
MDALSVLKQAVLFVHVIAFAMTQQVFEAGGSTIA